MADPQDFLKNLSDYYGTEEDAEARDAHALRDFVTYTPFERTAVIQQYDAVIDDGASMRKKAELMHFRQRLAQTHNNLRKANR
jgi:hypothetical protein